MAEPGNIDPPHDAEILNELLFLTELFLDNQTNNHYLDFDEMPCQHPIILEILWNHPLSYALSETAEVPDYVRVNRPGASYFTGRVDNRDV